VFPTPQQPCLHSKRNLMTWTNHIAILSYYKHNFSHFSVRMSSFHLSAKDSKKRKSYGLQKVSNVFGGGDSSSEEDDKGKNHVNRQLRHEQDALRQRATSAMYDFDGTYETPKTLVSEVKDNKPRYITDLLQQAKRRKQERELVHERKVARELTEEDADYAGKEKFITSAYKQKLAEREAWTRQDKLQEEQERLEDVTKQTSLAGFYANLNQNVALGGRVAKAEEEPEKEEFPNMLILTDGVERAEKDLPTTEAEHKPSTSDPPTISMRQIRLEKMEMARARYLQRRGMTPEEATKERLQ